ncbi:iron-containing alcohol dehydrogenase [Cellulomonas flavigena DSM 20109]|uniref:Iron-containing alcohol dehydrogenase n=1 Tax=Cellulomonas flavigena (strain ATCC 482 / DSM 20109 / BCRC 11376 / JCM 18109 / NBRC 3775 / NCIMB 8073 / NRS 134) TaxID=446466 RepID=D5UIE8_CELFN|nr:iron-containing alcohol dehydrogenase [Cellulomonas flavigena]ADG73447.1 iron-containing alcohol dehydrogenase [Cellulomonas flavigena DSM 20109]
MGSGRTGSEFVTAGRVVLGAGTAADVPGLVAGLGERVLVVAGRSADVSALTGATVHRHRGEPDVESVRAAVAVARDVRPDVVVGWGGGSVLDLAKCVAVLAPGTSDVLDHLEVVGRGLPLPDAALPVVAVPTTAGTGAEVTANAPVRVPQRGVKASLRGRGMLPAVAVVDPLLTLACPPALTAASGVDALTQCLEAFTTPFATPLTDPLARDGLVRAGRSLRRVVEHGDDVDARTDLSVAALLSGMALANAKLGAVHGLAAALGGRLGAPHGQVCAAVLAPTTAANVAALRRTGAPGLGRYDAAAVALTGRTGARADDAVAWLEDLVTALGVPGLGDLGLARADVPDVVADALAASSTRGNPVALTAEELTEVVAASW